MILVIGGTGTVGGQLVKQLAAKGAAFRVLTRDPGKVKGAEAVKGDLADPSSLDPAFRGAQAVFLLTNSSPESVRLKKNAIDAAKKAGVERVVNLSVLGAEANSPVQLSRWHAQTEQALRESGLAWTNLQPGFFMQNLLGMATIKSQGAIYGAAGEGKLAPIDARDIAAAAVEALTGKGHERKSYPLTGPEALSFAQIAEKLSKAVGEPIRYVNLPPDEFRKGLLAAGLPDWLVADYLAMHAWFASGGAGQVDPTLEKLIGRRQTFDEFAREHAQAFK